MEVMLKQIVLRLITFGIGCGKTTIDALRETARGLNIRIQNMKYPKGFKGRDTRVMMCERNYSIPRITKIRATNLSRAIGHLPIW